jgi:hypothetical protein
MSVGFVHYSDVGVFILLHGRLITLIGMSSACHSSPSARSGFLSSYTALPTAETNRKASAHHRNDGASNDVSPVFIQPTIIAPELETELSAEEKAMVLREVDRQICFEVSERFLIAAPPDASACTIRTAIVRLQSNSRVGSIAAAAVDFVNPVPIVNFRLPSSTGGLAIESELLAPDGNQVAAMLWTKNVGMVGRVKPSLSRAGDALQLAEPLGDKIGKSFASKDRPRIKLGKVDPCARVGSRKNIQRRLASGVVGGLTGLYMPQIAGTSYMQEEEDRRLHPKAEH